LVTRIRQKTEKLGSVKVLKTGNKSQKCQDKEMANTAEEKVREG